MRLGLKRGFSSGETLDYVYANKAQGFTPFGRLVDWFYLNSLGWICIRQRRQHMNQTLRRALEDLRKTSGSKLNIADIAGGPGRYLLDLLEEYPSEDLSVVIRDADASSLEKGRQLSEERGEKRVVYEKGDAFCPKSLAELAPLDLAIVSGLYELFPQNNKVQDSLDGLSKSVRKGGYLLYTNQPSHPQIELIAQTLTHGDGSPWVMRCRSTAEMDFLVETSGFKKLRTLIDDHGIFSVSLAQKVD